MRPRKGSIHLEQTPITRLQNELTRQFQRDARGTEAAKLLADYARAHDDWRKFVDFDPDVYTRNLVARTEHFEMLVLCWGLGQESPIHNHAGQNCWMAVLDGEIEETQFGVAEEGRRVRLVAGQVKVFSPGRVAFINDDIALHRVRPTAGRSGISLHLYSKPIDVCNVYDERTGKVMQRQLVYHSIDGNRVTARPGSAG
jgi:cysteine dioxygenase